MATKQTIKRILSELNPECAENKYCFYKLFLEYASFDVRTVEQIKCIEKFKWEINKNSNTEYSWEYVIEQWIEQGYAKAYSDIYDEELSIKELYKRTMELVKNN